MPARSSRLRNGSVSVGLTTSRTSASAASARCPSGARSTTGHCCCCCTAPSPHRNRPFGAWFADPAFGRIARQYEGRCLAFAHPTLATSITENLAWLLAQLPARKHPVDIVGHGRGGLLARALVKDGRLPVRRVCQIGSPNHGTPLAREPLAWLNGHVAMLAELPTNQALPTLEGVLALMRSVALGAEIGLPGVDTVLPESFAAAVPPANGRRRFNGSRSARTSSARWRAMKWRPTWWSAARIATVQGRKSRIRCGSSAMKCITTTISPTGGCANDYLTGFAPDGGRRCRKRLTLRCDHG